MLFMLQKLLGVFDILYLCNQTLRNAEAFFFTIFKLPAARCLCFLNETHDSLLYHIFSLNDEWDYKRSNEQVKIEWRAY